MFLFIYRYLYLHSTALTVHLVQLNNSNFWKWICRCSTFLKKASFSITCTTTRANSLDRSVIIWQYAKFYPANWYILCVLAFPTTASNTLHVIKYEKYDRKRVWEKGLSCSTLKFNLRYSFSYYLFQKKHLPNDAQIVSHCAVFFKY